MNARDLLADVDFSFVFNGHNHDGYNFERGVITSHFPWHVARNEPTSLDTKEQLCLVHEGN